MLPDRDGGFFQAEVVLVFAQQITRGNEVLVGAKVRAACLVASSFTPRALPEWLFAQNP